MFRLRTPGCRPKRIERMPFERDRRLAAALLGLLLMAGCGLRADEEEPLYDESVGADRCAVLTTADVADVTGVAAEAIDTRAVSGCLHSWASDSLWLGSVRVHDSTERAKRSFARYTADATAADIRQQRETVADSLERKAESGEVTGDEAVAGKGLLQAMPEDATVYQVIQNVGSEAALSNRGSMRIRHGNVVIWLTGKTDGRDWIDPERAAELGRRMVANLQRD